MSENFEGNSILHGGSAPDISAGESSLKRIYISRSHAETQRAGRL